MATNNYRIDNQRINKQHTDKQHITAKRDIYLNALRRAGRRITEQRRLICDYLAQTDSHPTPYQVYADLSAQYPDISRATVYNTLKVLQELGAIVEIGFGADHTHYDTDTSPHINLICLRCHEIEDFHLAPDASADSALPLGEIQAAVSGFGGFRPVAVRTDVFGFCRKCQERKRAEIREQWQTQREALGDERQIMDAQDNEQDNQQDNQQDDE